MATTAVKTTMQKYRLVRGVVPSARWYEPVGFLFLGYFAIFLVIVLPILFSFMLSVYDVRNSNIRMVLNKIGINIFALPFAFPDLFKGLDNYMKLLTDKDFIGTFIRSVIWTGVNVFFHVSIGIWLATLLNRKLPGKSFFMCFLSCHGLFLSILQQQRGRECLIPSLELFLQSLRRLVSTIRYAMCGECRMSHGFPILTSTLWRVFS
jgi:hypothetical protein